jgi:NAD(P)-dependent dehydrogenase (short-subunit alcohol dehydrogenase family)
VAKRELFPPPPVTWQLVDPGAGGAFAGRTVVVTGAAGLLGREMVAALLAQGAQVHAVDRDATGLAAVAQGCPSSTLHMHVADLADGDAATAAVAAIAEHAGGVDALIHCVGGNDDRKDFATIDAASWNRMLSMNLVAPALFTAAMLPLLAQVPASGVVMITSINGRVPSPWPHYAAAKAGAGKLMRDLAVQVAPQGIRVNAVAPGELVASADAARFGRFAPLGSTTVPCSAVVQAALFLADGLRSPCTTGQELAVDAAEELEFARLADWRHR